MDKVDQKKERTTKGIVHDRAELKNTANEIGPHETTGESGRRTSSSRHNKPSLRKTETGAFEEGYSSDTECMVYVSLDKTMDECEMQRSSRRLTKASSSRKDTDASVEGNSSDKGDMVYDTSQDDSDSSCGNDNDYDLQDNLSDSDADYEPPSAKCKGITKNASKPETSKKSSKQDTDVEKKPKKRGIKEKTTQRKERIKGKTAQRKKPGTTKEKTPLSLVCDFCGKTLCTKQGYKRHVEGHTNKLEGVTYPCQECNRVFYQKFALKYHETLHKPPAFTCELCGKSFTGKATLQNHMNLHTKQVVFTCPKCSKCFYSAKNLRRHILYAHEEKSECIACHICGEMKKHGAMKHHLQTVHTESERVYCPLCNKDFKVKQYLNDHLVEVHQSGGGNQFHCTWPSCDKVFTRRRTLRCHLKVHSDVRPHACTVCPKRFRTKRNLLNHTNWHNGIKPHQCVICGHRSLTKGNLTKHMEVHLK